MPWVRIDEHALNHVKILALSHAAFRLWVEGLAHCQKHLTDGMISPAALTGFRYRTTARVSELSASVDGHPPLWQHTEGGFQVHDYLQWNESRETVVADRDKARTRFQRWKKRVHNAVVDDVATGVHATPHHVHNTSERSHERSPVTVSPPREPSPSEAPEFSERAARFTERYASLFARFRNGAKYHNRPHLDHMEAMGLVAIWDDTRLDELAEAFLTTNDAFCRNGSGTIAQFRSRASWCDAKLREKGL